MHFSKRCQCIDLTDDIRVRTDLHLKERPPGKELENPLGGYITGFQPLECASDDVISDCRMIGRICRRISECLKLRDGLFVCQYKLTIDQFNAQCKG